MQLISKIKQAISIVEIIGRYTSLKESGPSQYKSCCPLHEGDNNPSFTVDEQKGTFHCFACQRHGDVIDFYQEIEKLSKREAISRLAKIANISSSQPPEMTPAEKLEYQARKTFELVQKGYAEQFWAQGSPGRRYMAERGISESILKEFGIGFCPNHFRGTEQSVRRMRLPDTVAVEYGLLCRSGKGMLYDPMFGRVTFPVENGKGIVAFGARAVGQADAKYRNTGNSPIFTKGGHIFGFRNARKAIRTTRTVVVTEGYIDVLSMHQAGFTNCVGTMGTALTDMQLALLKAECDTVIFLMDGDSAGKTAALRAVELAIQAGMSCRVADLPDGDDPDSLLRKPDGSTAMASVLDNARDGLDCWMRHLAAQPPEIQAEWISAFLSSRPGKIIRMIWAGRLGRHLGVSASELLAAVDGDLQERRP